MYAKKCIVGTERLRSLLKLQREKAEKEGEEKEREIGSVYELVNILGVSRTKISGFF